jgi:hypothetical protein
MPWRRKLVPRPVDGKRCRPLPPSSWLFRDTPNNHRIAGRAWHWPTNLGCPGLGVATSGFGAIASARRRHRPTHRNRSVDPSQETFHSRGIESAMIRLGRPDPRPGSPIPRQGRRGCARLTPRIGGFSTFDGRCAGCMQRSSTLAIGGDGRPPTQQRRSDRG